MPDVFVSYKKLDKDRVRPLVDHLRAGGLDVWWDEGIQPSMSWRAEIAKQLGAAKCVVAVWTQASVDPEGGTWVLEEANHGLARRVLAPVRLDLVAPPLGFGEIQFADLAAWSGSAADPRFQHFLNVVRALVAQQPVPQAPAPTNFDAPGISMRNVSMSNVTIQVGGDDAAAPAVPSEPRTPPRAARPGFSPSMAITQMIGIVLPLVGVVVFVFSMGNMACAQGNAPAFFCKALKQIAQPQEGAL